MFPSLSANPKILSAATLGLALLAATPMSLFAQAGAQATATSFSLPPAEPSSVAFSMPEDSGQAALEQSLRRLETTASVLYIVAHPDDEDGALMTYLSRGLGARVTLLTLTRGEGGQNAISGETYDALGLMRTSELLKADEYYASSQLWGTEADFGFSKTQQEAYARWGHDRVLYDAVLAVRQVRPQIIIATFVGGVSDGHGQHQVSGEVAQEAFKLAGDPKVFPEQLKNGLQPWQPLAMYSRSPFARVTSQGIFDYATGKWAPARFHNYITDQWIDGAPSVDVTLQVGTWDPLLGRSYAQIARQGWGEQKSQNGGANPQLSGPASSSYHLWAVARPAQPASDKSITTNDNLFLNSKVQIDTSLAALAQMVKGDKPQWLPDGLQKIDMDVKQYLSDRRNESGVDGARKLAPMYRQTLELYTRVKNSDLDAASKANLEFELSKKIAEFQSAFKQLLGFDMLASTTVGGGDRGGLGGARVDDETARSVTPGEDFRVRVHATQALGAAQLAHVWLDTQTGTAWKAQDTDKAIDPKAAVTDRIFRVHVAEDAAPTAPFNTRPSIEQPYYDISNEAWRERSFAPWPLAAWAEFTFDGLPIRIGSVVQTLQRVTGIGGIYQPLVVTPNIGVRIEPAARILPLDGSALPVKITVHATHAASGTVALNLPEGWHASPAEAPFSLDNGVDSAPIVFSVTPAKVATGLYNVEAVAHSGGHEFKAGWQTIGYPGIQPYNHYQAAKLDTRKVDVKLAPGLKVGYIMGPGDEVPEAIEELGVVPHWLSDAELSAGNYSAWNVIVVGIRAYSTRPAVAASQAHLDEYVRGGGTLVVQYQTDAFPAPLPLTVARTNVVDELAPVKLLQPSNPLLSWPNKITNADFDGWVEERGHSFLDSFDHGYTALTETADQGQDPQRGGLVVTHPGNGTYIYIAYALYRQLPELVPGSYRLLANMLSAGKRPK